IEAERIEAERIEAERIEAERIEAERIEAERIEAERIEAERLEAERIEAELIEAELIEAERLEQKRLEQEKLDKVKHEKERLKAEQLEKERLEQEQLETVMLEQENLELAKIEQEKAEIEQREKAALEKERLAMERIGREQEKLRLEREKLKHERMLLKQQKIEASKSNLEKQSDPNDLAAKLNQALETQSKTQKKASAVQEPEIQTVANELESTSSSNASSDFEQVDDQGGAQEVLTEDIDDILYDFEEESEITPESGGVSLFVDDNVDNVSDESMLESFVPEKHMLSIFLRQLEIAKQTYQLIEIKLNGFLIIIDHRLNTVYCNIALDSPKFKEYCSVLVEPGEFSVRDLDYDEAKTHQSFRREKSELSHSIESFVWAASVFTSKGRSPQNTDLSRIIGLKNQLNLKQLMIVPHMAEIIDLLQEGAYSLSEVQQKLIVKHAQVIDVYNALLNLGLIEFNPSPGKNNKPSAAKKDDAPKKLFGGFFKRKGR
uniref:hypothetical protein n=1 Tax=uncultured Cocleimonas sp. TaxID=1051587 RepID=UPI0026099EFF